MVKFKFMRTFLSKINKFFLTLSENKISQTIRDGMVSVFPVLLLGCVSLLLKNFPINAYQNFINTFANGFISNLVMLVYNGTFGCLSCFVVMVLSISYSRNDSGSEINFEIRDSYFLCIQSSLIRISSAGFAWCNCI